MEGSSVVGALAVVEFLNFRLPCEDYEKLAIFGDIRGRRGTELKAAEVK